MAYYAPGTIIPSKLYLIQTNSKKHDFFPFLDLPGEIRNKIYDFAFEECVIDVRRGYKRKFADEILYPPVIEFRHEQFRQHDRRLQPGGLKQPERQPVNKILQPNSKAESKPDKQASASLHEQPRRNAQKWTKAQPQGRRGGRRPMPCMYHTVLSSSGPTAGGNPAKYNLPFNFLLSSRQIYSEALSVMYTKTFFQFISIPAIDRFLSVTPLRALQAIEGLDLSYETYGEPELTENLRYKVSADQKWSTTCREISKKMTDLKKLRLNLILNDWPSQLGLQEQWAKPVLSLRRNGLDRVDVSLSHFAFSEERLKEAAQSLENAMMSNKGRIAKSAHDKKLAEAKKKKMESKALKVLVIKMDNISTTKNMPKA
jgi:hypothetical protein